MWPVDPALLARTRRVSEEGRTGSEKTSKTGTKTLSRWEGMGTYEWEKGTCQKKPTGKGGGRYYDAEYAGHHLVVGSCWRREAMRQDGQGRRGLAIGGRELAHVMHCDMRRCVVGDGGGRGMGRGRRQVGQVVKTVGGWVGREARLVQRQVIWAFARASVVVVRVGDGSSGSRCGSVGWERVRRRSWAV